MNTKTVTRWKIVALAIVALGIGLRFVNLGKKPYWIDEAVTSLRVSGYRPSEMKAEIFKDRDVHVTDLRKYQHVNPDRGLSHTILSLVVGDPQHPPLYFVLTRVWAGIVGDSSVAIRAFTAVIAIFTIPAVFWLCLELFQSRMTAWVAMVLMAVSPFQFVYAQEARSYSLLTLMTIVSTALLMRATRLQKSGTWWAYAIALVLGIYTHLMFANVLMAHGIYMLVVTWREHGITRRAWFDLKPFLLATAAGIVMFVPWMMVIVLHAGQLVSSTAWARVNMELSNLIKSWCSGMSSVFIDPKYDLRAPWSYPVRLPALLLIGFSIYFLWRTTSMRRSLPVITLIFCTAIPLMVPDLVIGGRRSANARFWVPAYIGMQIAMAYLLATQIMNAQPIRRWFWQTTSATIVAAGVVSCAIIAQAETWWNKENGLEMQQIARILNRADSSLLIASPTAYSNLGTVLSLSHLLNENVRIRLTPESRVPPLPERSKAIFVLEPSEKMRRGLEQLDDNRILVRFTNRLWRWQDKQEMIAQP